MKILLQKATIVTKSSGIFSSKKDILIENGKITAISDNIATENCQLIASNDLHVSIGWLDMQSVATDPGFESKEDLASHCLAAAKGGFTEIVLLPNTKPVVQTKSSVAYVKQFSKLQAVEIHTTAAVTKEADGKDFTEMLDLHYAGAIAFSDGLHPLWNADILLKTLQYLHPIGGLLMNRAEEPMLAAYGQMHEGISSTLLGMKGIPSAAEEIMIQRDLKLVEYADLKSDLPILHFSKISTKEGVALLREAKAKGLPVSCDIASSQLAFLDTDLMTFDTNLKVSPPFRSEEDKMALIQGLKDGTIDTLISDHHPQDEESKKMEFDLADVGIINLQTSFSIAFEKSGLLLRDLIDKLTVQNRRILRREIPTIEVGNAANLTIFDPTLSWTFTEENNVSKSVNSPFFGREMKGKVLGIIHQNKAEML